MMRSWKDPHRGSTAGNPTFLAGCLLCLCWSGSALAQTQPGAGPYLPFNQPQTSPQPAAMFPTLQKSPTQFQVQPSAPGRILPVQASSEEEPEPLPPEIAAMPEVEAEMELIQNRSQLLIARENITRIAIADPGVMDFVQYSPKELSLIGTGIGSTTMTLWFENNDDPLIYLVTVIRDPSLLNQRRMDYGKLEQSLTLLFPNSKVYLIPLSRKIIVKGQARDAEEAARILEVIRGEVINQLGDLGGPGAGFLTNDTFFGGLGANFNANDLGSSLIVNMLEVPGEQQVMVHVSIAELNRSQLRTMGVDLTYLINSGRSIVSSSVGGVPSTLTGIFENGEVDVLMNWLASNGSAKILARPSLATLSGHPANFLSGGEFAVPTIVGVGGAQGTSTTFRGFGVSLQVVPTVVDRDLVRLQIQPSFSEIEGNNAVNGIPGLNTRRASTTVQLREGQTIALAGLFSRQQATEVTRIPGLAAIPKIGPVLFSAKRATEDETELLVLVTPEIIRPMDADEVPPVPGFEVTHPTDEDLYCRAMTEGAPNRGVYQLAPYGRGTGDGVEVGYRVHEPNPGHQMMAPGMGSYGPGAAMPYGTPGQGAYCQPQVQPYMMGAPTGPMPATQFYAPTYSGGYEMQGQPMTQPQPGQPMTQPQPGYPMMQPQPSYPMMQPTPAQPLMQPTPAVPQGPLTPVPSRMQPNSARMPGVPSASHQKAQPRQGMFSRLFDGNDKQPAPQPNRSYTTPVSYGRPAQQPPRYPSYNQYP